jgi:hypothetical protein
MRHLTHYNAKENTQGRHYAPKSATSTAQAFDPTHAGSCEIAKTDLILRKLG